MVDAGKLWIIYFWCWFYFTICPTSNSSKVDFKQSSALIMKVTNLTQTFFRLKAGLFIQYPVTFQNSNYSSSGLFTTPSQVRLSEPHFKLFRIKSDRTKKPIQWKLEHWTPIIWIQLNTGLFSVRHLNGKVIWNLDYNSIFKTFSDLFLEHGLNSGLKCPKTFNFGQIFRCLLNFGPSEQLFTIWISNMFGTQIPTVYLTEVSQFDICSAPFCCLKGTFTNDVMQVTLKEGSE